MNENIATSERKHCHFRAETLLLSDENIASSYGSSRNCPNFSLSLFFFFGYCRRVHLGPGSTYGPFFRPIFPFRVYISLFINKLYFIDSLRYPYDELERYTETPKQCQDFWMQKRADRQARLFHLKLIFIFQTRIERILRIIYLT